MEYKDYYATLDVSKEASQEEIQKAYRKLARKFHPDVNKEAGAEDRFKEINEAYEVLKDPEKRAKYDRFGSAWRQAQHGGAPPPDFEDIFSRFGFGGAGAEGPQRVEFHFGEESPFSSFFEALFGGARGGPSAAAWSGGGTRGAAPVQSGADLEARIALTLEDAARGGKRQIQITDPTTGRRKTLAVTIPGGVRPGQRIRLAGQGTPGVGASRGDLYLKIEILPDPRFRLDEDDLYATVPIAPWEAALGGKATVPTLNGDVTVKIPAGSSSGRRIRLAGKGFPNPGGKAGDLYLDLRVVVPKHLSDEEGRLFRELAKTSRFDPRS